MCLPQRETVCTSLAAGPFKLTNLFDLTNHRPSPLQPSLRRSATRTCSSKSLTIVCPTDSGLDSVAKVLPVRGWPAVCGQVGAVTRRHVPRVAAGVQPPSATRGSLRTTVALRGCRHLCGAVQKMQSIRDKRALKKVCTHREHKLEYLSHNIKTKHTNQHHGRGLFLYDDEREDYCRKSSSNWANRFWMEPHAMHKRVNVKNEADHVAPDDASVRITKSTTKNSQPRIKLLINNHVRLLFCGRKKHLKQMRASLGS